MTADFVARQTLAAEGAALLEETYPDAACDLHFTSAFELLVATVLSAQTTDRRVNEVTPELFASYPGAAQMAAAPVRDLEEIVRPLGMFRRRAAALHGLSTQLQTQWGGVVPGTRADLVTLPGVGRKTANVVLGNWFGEDEITVDTHVGRVTRRLGWATARTPEAVEKELWRLLPDAPWTKLCHQIIWHGRRVCHARKPLCDGCVLADICPSAT